MVINIEARKQEEIDVFCRQLDRCFSQLTAELFVVKDNGTKMKALLTNFKTETDDANQHILAVLNNLENRLNDQQSISLTDLAKLEEFWIGQQQAMKEELKEHITGAIVDVPEGLDKVAEKGEAILKGVHDVKDEVNELRAIILIIFNDQNLNAKQKETRKELAKKLKISLKKPLEFLSGVELGIGGFGSVRLALYQGSKVAVKSVRMKNNFSQDDTEAVENEVLVMHYIGSHPNILTCFGFYKDPEGGLHLILEYAKYNSLFTLIRNKTIFPDGIPIRLVLAWLCDLINALQFIHSREVKHRDVKAENLLVFDGIVAKLCDFGLAKQHSSHKGASTMGAGTIAFMAPEVFEKHGSSYASDIFSWGMTAVQLITRRTPNHLTMSESLVATAMEVMREDPDVSANLDVQSVFTSLLLKCVDRNPKKRPEAAIVYSTVSELLIRLGGDPRSKRGKDKTFMRQLSEKADDWSEELESGGDGSLSPLISPSTVKSPPTTIENKSSSSVEEPTVPLSSLSSDEAIALLIDLGSREDLKERLKGRIAVTGAFLTGITSGKHLQLLENDDSLLREIELNVIYKKLEVLQQQGIPSQQLESMRSKITAGSRSQTELLSEVPVVPVHKKSTSQNTSLVVVDEVQVEATSEGTKGDPKQTIATLLPVESPNSLITKEYRYAMSIPNIPKVSAVCQLKQNGDGIVFGTEDGNFFILDFENESDTCLFWETGNYFRINALIQLSDGRLASGSADNLIKIWNHTTLSCEFTIGNRYTPVYALCELATGLLLSGSKNGSIEGWNLQSGIREKTLLGHSGVVQGIGITD